MNPKALDSIVLSVPPGLFSGFLVPKLLPLEVISFLPFVEIRRIELRRSILRRCTDTLSAIPGVEARGIEPRRQRLQNATGTMPVVPSNRE